MKKSHPFFFALLFLTQVLAAQVDTVPPVLICKQQLSLLMLPTGMLTVDANYLVDSVYDQSPFIQLGIRKQCTGTGFSEKNSLLYTSQDLGQQKVEVWARDQTGNTSACLSTIYIGDNGSADQFFSFIFKTVIGQGLDSVFVDASGSNCLSDSFAVQIFAFHNPDWSPLQRNYTRFGTLIPAAGYNSNVTPFKNDRPLNGVTTYDLALISKHILGIQPFYSPYQFIAADANIDGFITKADIVLLQSLIMGLIDELPHGKSWRFLPFDYAFPHPTKPLATPFPESIHVPNTDDPAPSTFGFIGIKIGDVNFSAEAD